MLILWKVRIAISVGKIINSEMETQGQEMYTAYFKVLSQK